MYNVSRAAKRNAKFRFSYLVYLSKSCYLVFFFFHVFLHLSKHDIRLKNLTARLFGAIYSSPRKKNMSRRRLTNVRVRDFRADLTQ